VPEPVPSAEFIDFDLAFLATLYTLCVASMIALLALAGLFMLVSRRGRDSALLYLKRCGFAALPLLLGAIIFAFAFSRDPLWPAQDETPDGRAARLAAREFADRIYVVSAILSAVGLLWFSRVTLSALSRNVPRGRSV
jgi:hypothetical protein